MMNKEEIEKIVEEFGIKVGKIDELNLPWHTKFFMKFFPKIFLKIYADDSGIKGNKVNYAYKLFNCSKVHIEPFSGGSRGFIITLDNNLTLWFFQDGDHFKFDGIEMGEYSDGEVTILDNIKK